MQALRQNLVQQQRLNLSPQLVQSIKLMAMPFADLREQILEEVEKNPALEVVADPFDAPMPSRMIPEAPDRFPVSLGGGDEESDEHRDFIEGVLHRDATLQEYLLEQLGELSLDSHVHDLASLVIQNLDRDGFHRVDPAELLNQVPENSVPANSVPANPEILEKALETVRRFDPAGCAARDFHESLVVQAKLLRPAPGSGKTDELLEKTITILERYFTLLEKGRPDVLVKALGKHHESGITLDLDEATGVFDIIRSLDPFPGRRFDNTPGSFVVPDVLVKKTEDGFAVVINDEEIPVLGISPFFMEMNEDASQKEARDFARESVKEARWFISTIQRRNLTILKLVRALVVYQSDFFRHGPAHVAPLRMKDIAEEIGMHEATVSRAANGKYLQCEWGIFELRYFFSNMVGSGATSSLGASASSGIQGRFSKQGVKEVIREIIASSKENLSDQKIMELLETRGITIARRTVAKYRNELTIKSSFER